MKGSEVRSIVPFIEKNYFLDKQDFVTVLAIYEEFIDGSHVGVVNCNETSQLAHALGNAQRRNITNVADIDLYKLKEMKHIINAVSITIFDNFNVLVANVIPKYFSRDVYYEIGAKDSEKLFTVYCFDDNASFTYGIVKSISLELTLAVV